MYAIFGVMLLITTIPQDACAGQRGLFVGRYYYQPGPYYQQLARDSKMNTLFLFTMEVEANGTLTFNTNNTRYKICENGRYVGNSVWDQQLAACKDNGGSVQRIEMCIGQWGSQSFNNIRNLQAAANLTGTPITQTILYANFRALKNKLPIYAIQMDDETTFHRTSMVTFCKMLHDHLNLKVSLCPYNNQTFWKNVKSDLGSRVSGVWLQCYDGGANNDPVQWKTAMGNSAIIYPGCILWDGPTTIERKMKAWYNQGIRGGFVLGDIEPPDPRWGQALINAGF
jgi:hypothetical protein